MEWVRVRGRSRDDCRVKDRRRLDLGNPEGTDARNAQASSDRQDDGRQPSFVFFFKSGRGLSPWEGATATRSAVNGRSLCGQSGDSTTSRFRQGAEDHGRFGTTVRSQRPCSEKTRSVGSERTRPTLAPDQWFPQHTHKQGPPRTSGWQLVWGLW